MVGAQKTNYHLKLYSTLWEYQMTVKNATRFTPFHLVYGLEAVLLVEFENQSLKLSIEIFPNTTAKQERFLYLTQLDESHRNDALTNEAHKQCIE